jgi:chaperonin GroES
MTKLVPLHDKILIKRIEAENVSLGGIVIPDAHVEKPNKGTVLAVGQGKYKNGELVAPVVSEGDVVLFGKHSGYNVKIDNEELTILNESEIYAIIQE